MIDPDLEKLVVDLHQLLRNRFFGKYRGLVKEVSDKGCVRALVPEVFGDTISPWAMPAVPYAGKSHGVIALPLEGDGIWIEFEAGDRSRPIWSGSWWADNEIPQGKETLAFVTSNQNKVLLDDGKNEIRILHKSGAAITMSDEGITLQFNSAKIVLSSSGVSINGMT